LRLLEKGGSVKNPKITSQLIALLGKQEKSIDYANQELNS